MLLLRQGGDHWEEPAIAAYSDEAHLQTLLAASPSLLPIEGPLVAAREVSAGDSGFIDLVAVDVSGAITLVECKLASNPEIRRKVVGQILAYASALWHLPADDFLARVDARLDTALMDSLEQLSRDDWDPIAFHDAVEDNLERGTFTLVVAVDEITDELRRIIEYTNSHTADDVVLLALELGYVSHGGTEIVIPSVYGVEAATRKNAATTRWHRDKLIASLEAGFAEEAVAAVKALIAHAEAAGAHIHWGTGRQPAFAAHYPLGDTRVSLFAVYLRPTGASLALRLTSMQSAGLGEEEVAGFLSGTRAAFPDSGLPTSGTATGHPEIRLDGVDAAQLKAFLAAVSAVGPKG